jgi:hypothetical protein
VAPVFAFGGIVTRQLPAARSDLRDSIVMRHRSSLIQMAAEHVLHMQKALDQMNLQIHRVLNDITGGGGLKILDAILAGQRRRRLRCILLGMRATLHF